MRYMDTRKNAFDDVWNDMLPWFGGNRVMRTDIHEKDGNYVLDVDLPGYKKEDVKISLYNGDLTISAEHHESSEEKDAKGNLIRQERYTGSCSRSFHVGEGMKESDIHASFKDGILTVTIPTEVQKEEPETKFIDIL